MRGGGSEGAAACADPSTPFPRPRVASACRKRKNRGIRGFPLDEVWISGNLRAFEHNFDIPPRLGCARRRLYLARITFKGGSDEKDRTCRVRAVISGRYDGSRETAGGRIVRCSPARGRVGPGRPGARAGGGRGSA